MCKSIYAAAVRIFMPSGRHVVVRLREIICVLHAEIYRDSQFDAAHPGLTIGNCAA
jgi:hypothetical protein